MKVAVTNVKTWTLALRAAALAFPLLVGACGMFEAPPQLRGNRVDPDDLKALVPGTSTRADVTALIGSPTARATFDDNTWLYISETTYNRIGRTPGVQDQQVVVLTFNDQGVLNGVQTRDQEDAVPVTVVTRATPSPGTEASFLQQLFGNIGRFNALGAGQPAGGARGGAPTPF